MLHADLISPELRPIAGKIRDGARLDFEDGVALYRTSDLLGLGCLANAVRERHNGNYAYFIVNRHINHTNVCANQCRFCAYYRQEGQEGAYTMPLEEVFQKAVAHAAEGISELHIVGACTPRCPTGTTSTCSGD